MPKFSKKSIERLLQCDKRLQKICLIAIELFDFTVISGSRTKEEQNQLYKEGKTKLKYPHSKHNRYPSLAIDLAPYPTDWNNPRDFVFLAGIIFTIAEQNDIKIRWGGAWNGFNDIPKIQNFDDLGHFELIDEY